MEREVDARTLATQLGRGIRKRLGALKSVRQPLEATAEQREAWRRLGRDRFADPDHQRWAQSHRSRESLNEAGRLGYQETAHRYGSDFADRFAAQWRCEHSTEPERRMMELLAELGTRRGAATSERARSVAGEWTSHSRSAG